jgi:hypothetical protein
MTLAQLDVANSVQKQRPTAHATRWDQRLVSVMAPRQGRNNITETALPKYQIHYTMRVTVTIDVVLTARRLHIARIEAVTAPQ